MIQSTISDGVCLLRLDAPPRNVLSPPLLDRLVLAIAEANRTAGIAGIVLCGDEKQFSTGADVELFAQVRTADDAVHLSRVFQEAFQAIEDSLLPVVAALAGPVLGGAIELASACHYRVAAERTEFSMPEVRLGINPGAGGTQRLPRLVGLEAALDMLLKASTIDAQRALALGLIDEVCPAGRLLERAAAMARSGLSPRKSRDCTDKVCDPYANTIFLGRAEAEGAACRPEFVAPQKILEAVRVGLEESFAAGLRHEQIAFAECVQTLPVANKLYHFTAVREMSKAPELAGVRPAAIARAAVVGMGTMGAGIAQAIVMAGVPVVVVDENPKALAKGPQKIRTSLERRVAQGKLERAKCDRMLASLTATSDIAAVRDADLVVEAVFEDLDIKRRVLAQIESVCGGEAILATNTSTINLDRLAEGLRHAERLVGMHFFNPAHYLPLVEIIRREATPLEPLATVMQFAKHIRKRPVLLRNREGFLVNRVFVPYLKEAFILLEEGAAPVEIDAAMVEFGFPMGPLAVSDLAGIDILVNADRVMQQVFSHHGPMSPIALRLVESGQLGQKTGSGVYRYDPGDTTPHPSGLAQQVIAGVQKGLGCAPRGLGQREIVQRLVLRMVAETFRVIEERVAASESDVDAATVLGVGFPDFRGGVMKYARDVGLDTILTKLQELTAKCGPRYEPCEGLTIRRSKSE